MPEIPQPLDPAASHHLVTAAGLKGHRIAAGETAAITSRYPRHVGRNARLGHHGSGGETEVAVVRTDSGHVGWGPPNGSLAGAEALRDRPLDELFDPGYGYVDESAAALDLALHDLAARILSVPVHAMLGGRGPATVPVYDGAIYLDDLDPEDAPRGVDAVLANCAADHARGHRAFKLKIGRGARWMDGAAGCARDVDVTREVRAAFPDCRLLVDANDGYTCDGFLAYLRAVIDCELYWVEEPFPENRADLARLRAYLRAEGSSTLIADGESDPDEEQLLALAREGLVDVLLMDVVTYGPTRWRRVMPEIEACGVAASPHAWGLPVKTLYAAQLAAGLGNVPIVEGVPGSTAGVRDEEFAWEGGRLTVPSDTPGFGLALGPGTGTGTGTGTETETETGTETIE